MDLQERAFRLTLKWMELSDPVKNVNPTEFANKFLYAHQDILRVLMDNEPPESIDASSFLSAH